jgi:type I restriction enzyme R subunit
MLVGLLLTGCTILRIFLQAAITEGLLCGNLEADYLLFIDGKAVGVLEAKKEDTDVSSIAVVRQAENYTYKVPNWYQTWAKPLPIILSVQWKDCFIQE